MGNFSAAPGALFHEMRSSSALSGKRSRDDFTAITCEKAVKSVKDEAQRARFSVQVGLILGKDEPD